MRIRIEATDLPGRTCAAPAAEGVTAYPNVHVGVQRRGRPGELLGLQPGDAPAATWTLDTTAEQTPAGTDVRGPYVQGGPGRRFVHLSWGSVDDAGAFAVFRRAKLLLDAVPADVLAAAARTGLLVGRLGLTDARGMPLCARVVPPVVTWTAGADR
ncbi:DUF5990 family protein [Streptomyces sp. NPDC050085]|uniref:DUF5990 family protein n=1 Tax=Streptomyces sp. NPDC050085 TaxID=3365600 RepID=UPI00379B7AA0